MFRLLAQNTGASLRPVLLRNVRPAAPLKLTTPNAAIELERSFQFRNNSSAATGQGPKTDAYISRVAEKTFVPERERERAPERTSETPEIRASQFESLLFKRTGQVIGARKKTASSAHYASIKQLTSLFHDPAVQARLSGENVYEYTNLLNEAIYTNRYERLNDNRNRDSDMYSSVTLSNDIWMKNAVLDLADALSTGPLQSVVNPRILRKLLFAMLQLRVGQEMLKFWEHGVNDPQHSASYLAQTVLAVILPVAYAERRFSYDQAIKLFEVNTRKKPFVAFQLTAAVGKIAIEEGDYSRGLDCLEKLLAYLEGGRFRHTEVHRTLAELHMAFVGECRDIRIARHFFSKSLDDSLPYRVVLKAPHVSKLMEHCKEAGEPFDTIVDFWRQTVARYSREPQSSFNARYSMINKTFFALFFRYYPRLSEAGYAKLKEVIAIYASVKKVDDYFLNNIIANYTWGDKAVFEQLSQHYEAYHVTPSAVSYRVALKKMGEIEAFSVRDILHQWNTTLSFLDGAGFSYIPIADWASLREATILSPFRRDRTEFYLAVLHAYRNFHQDDKAVHRFVRYWSTKPEDPLVARVHGPDPCFECDVAIERPDFVNLRENVNYDVLAKNLVVATREENQAQSESR